MKKGLKFTKQELIDLYHKQKLSLTQIGKKFGCNGSNILYWLKKFDIKRRSVDYRTIKIPKEILEDLYWNKKLSSSQIAKKFGIKHGRTILKKLKKHGVKSKTVSEALTKKFKAPFSGDLIEKSFFLGLRAGDFYAKKIKLCYRMQTSSTHQAQIDLLKNAFKNYGETKTYLSKNKARGSEWFIYTDLHPSFSFLLEKPQEIPKRIINDNNLFYSFLSAYSDCEGNWHFSKSHGKHLRVTYRLRTGDRRILEQIKAKLEIEGYHPLFNIVHKKGDKSPSGKFNFDIYSLILNRKKDIHHLTTKLLPFSKHSEKIRKMNFILEHKGKRWKEIEPAWNKLKEDIEKELLKNQS